MSDLPARLAPVKTAAARHDLTERSIFRYLKDGRLTRYKEGPQTRIDLDELDALYAPRLAG